MLHLFRHFVFTATALLFCVIAKAGSPVTITISPEFGGNSILPGFQTYTTNNNIEITFQTLKFYISNVKLVNQTETVFTEQNSYHLMDANEVSSLAFNLNIPGNVSFNKIVFDLGIDSTTNVSGAMGGDLDPTKGMYWTWQSGYINFKLEGSVQEETNSKRDLQLHIGGYNNPFNALQTISLETKSTGNIYILLDLKSVLSSINLNNELRIMSPSQKAVEISNQIASAFYIK